MSDKLERRKNRKLQLRINNKIKKSMAKSFAMKPCCYCKKVFLIADLTIEHLVPLSWGGTNDISNIDLACGPCNRQRGRESWFLKRQILKNQHARFN